VSGPRRAFVTKKSDHGCAGSANGHPDHRGESSDRRTRREMLQRSDAVIGGQQIPSDRDGLLPHRRVDTSSGPVKRYDSTQDAPPLRPNRGRAAITNLMTGGTSACY
jgi:hypothetical protein